MPGLHLAQLVAHWSNIYWQANRLSWLLVLSIFAGLGAQDASPPPPSPLDQLSRKHSQQTLQWSQQGREEEVEREQSRQTKIGLPQRNVMPHSFQEQSTAILKIPWLLGQIFYCQVELSPWPNSEGDRSRDKCVVQLMLHRYGPVSIACLTWKILDLQVNFDLTDNAFRSLVTHNARGMQQQGPQSLSKCTKSLIVHNLERQKPGMRSNDDF